MVIPVVRPLNLSKYCAIIINDAMYVHPVEIPIYKNILQLGKRNNQSKTYHQ